MNQLIHALPGLLPYRITGKGPAEIVLLHGFGEDSSIWKPVAHYLEAYPFRLIMPDLPGFGGAEVIEDVTISQMAQLVFQLIDQLGLSDPIVLGHSMGGYVALSMAESAPQKLRGFGLIHSHPYADSEAKKQERLKSMDFIARNGSKPFLQQLYPKLFPAGYAEKHPRVLERLFDTGSAFPPDGIRFALQAMANRDEKVAVLSETNLPVLFVIGEEDGLLPPEKWLAQTHLPKTADIHLLQHIGHMGLVEAPETLAGIIAGFARFCD